MITAIILVFTYIAFLIGATMACEILADLIGAAIRRKSSK